MTWTYSQKTGTLTHDGQFEGTGYSGTNYGKNNPDAQQIQGIGPVPQGSYTIGAAYDDEHLGPCVMHLDPNEGTEEFGRSAFRIHGDNVNHDASHGCVILGPSIRHLIADSGDTDFVVTA
jgi:hypothetical protein